MRILGVDPGAGGALALLDGPLLRIADMPTFVVSRGKAAKAEVDVRALFDLLAGWGPDVCYFEQVSGIPGQAAGAAFNFGRAAGLAEAAAKSTPARFVFVPPATWKRKLGLLGGGKPEAKDAARALATNLFPASAAEFRRKKDADRAEAALIAEYGRRLEAPAPRSEDIFA